VRSPHRAVLARAVAIVALLVAVAAVGSGPAARAASYPPAPLALDRQLLSNLSAPSVVPGGSTSVSFRLHDPPAFFPLSHLQLTLEVYALNGYPGDAVGPVPVANAPVLENSTSSGGEVNLSYASLALGSTINGSVRVVTSSTTPAGTYAVRTALGFTANGSVYRFESRGWFSASAWANATAGGNGSATVNASRLGVSGIVPETALLVAPSGWPVALGALLAAGLVVVGLGAWLYFRSGPRSSSGAAKAPAPGETNAPSAFGSRRTSPGDSRNS